LQTKTAEASQRFMDTLHVSCIQILLLALLHQQPQLFLCGPANLLGLFKVEEVVVHSVVSENIVDDGHQCMSCTFRRVGPFDNATNCASQLELRSFHYRTFQVRGLWPLLHERPFEGIKSLKIPLVLSKIWQGTSFSLSFSSIAQLGIIVKQNRGSIHNYGPIKP
jgi:hypothetical protein